MEDGELQSATLNDGVWHRRPTIVGRLCETADPKENAGGDCSPSGRSHDFAAKTELCVTVSEFFKPRFLSISRA